MKTFEVTQDYDPKTFADFIYDFLPEDYSPKKQQAYFDYTNIEEGYKLGTCKSLSLDVYEFRTKSKRDPRITLTREVVSLMKKYGCNQNALVVFYSNKSHNWRLSLITTDYEIVNDKVKPLYSNPRRFSFRLGAECKAHTPQTMLFKKGPINKHTENGKTLTAIEDLKSRFALEVVSKQFFNEYKAFYEDFVQYITGNRYVKTSGKGKYERKSVSKENTKIFSQFKKIADGDYDLACKYVRDYIKKFMGRLVFLQFLQKKGWLGVARNDSWGNGNKNFLMDLFSSTKYKNDFLKKVLEPLFFGMLNTDLNDRKKLFDSKKWDLDLLENFKQIPYLNGGLFEDDILDSIDMKFPKEMFSNPAMADKERSFNDKKDYSKEPYPFTESCGLLDFFARYNFTIDETDPTDMEIGVEPEMLGKIFENLLEDNKDKGAFYTPKEIVQYMCRESLIAYLGDNDKIRTLVTTHVSNFNDTEKKELIKNLKTVKVCDPAVGSGAFPMGMLNELFACRVALGEDEEASEIKKQIVRENIYGVDIEKGAVDIARLRFWLAIIVDEKEPIPLPNLDYKIMQGNSLLESYEGIDLSNLTKSSDELFDNDEIIQQLREAVDGFYSPSDHIAKAKIRNQIREKVIQLLKDRQLPPATIKKLESIDLHSNSDFFLWHTWFSDVFNRPGKNGFDIVIGNPPYFKYEGNHKGEIETLKRQKELKSAFGGKLNAYKLFLAKALSSLLSNNGIICYIFQNSFLADQQASLLREEVFNSCQIISIDSYPERDNPKKRVFESVKMSVCIPIIKKCKTNNSFKVHFWDDKYKSSGITTIFTKNDIFSIDSKYYTIPRIKTEYIGLLKKLRQLNTLPVKCYEGELNMTFHKPYFVQDKSKPKILKGASIQRYFYTEEMSQGEIEYLNEGKYLKDFSGEKTLHHELERIAMQGMTGANDKIRIVMSLVPKGIYLANSCNYLLPTKEFPAQYLLALMNSKIINWYFRCFSTNSNVNGYEVESFPVPNEEPIKKGKIIALVDKILAAKKLDINADTSDLESQIDELVYTLYNLTEEEKNIIRGK